MNEDQHTSIKKNSNSKSSTSFWKKAFITLAILFVLCVATIGFLWWWTTRPIKATVLSQPEEQQVELKMARLSGDAPPEIQPNPDTPNDPNSPSDPEQSQAERSEPTYEKGSKTLVFTERELNGLLNKNTQLGESLKFSLGTDAINARIHTTIPEDFFIGAGQPMNGRTRIIAKMVDNVPQLILEDVTLWGLSLPNAWLADLKNKNLLEIIHPDLKSNPSATGIEDIKIEPGKLIIQFAE